MGMFMLYFAICLLALIVRGYYRVPPSCIDHKIIDKEENTMQSIIKDHDKCKCHYKNFFWNEALLHGNNQTNISTATKNIPTNRQFEPIALVRNKF